MPLLSLRSNGPRYPVVVAVDGRREHYQSFKIKLDFEKGTIHLEGTNSKGTTRRCLRI